MSQDQKMVQAIYDGWQAYQNTLIAAIAPLSAEQLQMRLGDKMLSVGEIGAHIVRNRAVWFFYVMQEQTPELEAITKWDVYGENSTNAAAIVAGLEQTWDSMHALIANWTEADWNMTWPDEDDPNTPDVLTRPWIIWHMIEHDIHHAGEISIMLGSFGLDGLKLSG